MPTDPTMAILFLIFLALFVLFGTTPVLPRLFTLVGTLLRAIRRWQGGGIKGQTEPEEGIGEYWESVQLNDYEIIVIRKLAMGGDKGMSRKALANALYFKPATIRKALISLQGKGLVRSAQLYLISERYFLSETGRHYAAVHDLVPHYHSQGKGDRFLFS